MSETDQPKETRVSANALIEILTQLLSETVNTNKLLQSQNEILTSLITKLNAPKPQIVTNQLLNGAVTTHPRPPVPQIKQPPKNSEQLKVVRELHQKYPNLASGKPVQDENGFAGLTPPEWQNQEVPVKDVNTINPTMYR